MKTGTDSEILAVITAALAAYRGRNTKLVVKSFRRITQRSPIWNVTGRIEKLRKW